MVRFNTVVANGTIVTPRDRFRADVAIAGGQIAAVLTPGHLTPAQAERWIDASQLTVLPGVIDAHVHLYDPGWTEWEDFTSGTRAAAAGGITTILEMPNSLPPVDCADTLRSRLDAVGGRAVVDFGLYGGLGEANPGAAAALADAGAIAFKTFRSQLPPGTERARLEAGIRAPDAGVMLDRFRESAATGLVHAVHVEDDALCRHFEAAARAAGWVRPEHHNRGRPELCEIVSTVETLALAREARARLHLVHMSSPDAIAHAVRARETGQRVTVETRPEYLQFTEGDLRAYGPYGKIHPPLRSKESQARLWELVRDGSVDIIGSDHTPNSAAEKERHPDNIWDAPTGEPGLEAMLPMLLTHVNAGRLTLERLTALLSENPARIFGLYPRKGVIQPGADADLVLVDLHRPQTLRAQAFYTKSRDLCRWFDGMAVTGTPVATLVRGTVVCDHGEVIASAGQGRFLRPLK